MQGRIEADVDADASDDEELKPGLGMRFWDDKIEEDWEQARNVPKEPQATPFLGKCFFGRNLPVLAWIHCAG